MVDVLLILDGASDPVSAAPTSLEQARTPELDRLARVGTLSARATTPPDLQPGSETAIPVLLGWTPTGPVDRGLVEAAARALPVPAGSRAWRIDAVNGDGSRASAVAADLVEQSLRSELAGYDLHRIGGHKLLAIGPEPLPLRSSAGLRIWPAGIVPPHILDKRTVVVCALGAAAGIARLLGAKVIVPAGATGWIDNDLAAKATAAEQAAAGAHTVVVHVGAPDEAAHRLDRMAKIAALERADRELVPRLVAFAAAGGGSLTICADHGCDPATGLHCAEPVPSLRWTPLDRPHTRFGRFTERAILEPVAA